MHKPSRSRPAASAALLLSRRRPTPRARVDRRGSAVRVIGSRGLRGWLRELTGPGSVSAIAGAIAADPVHPVGICSEALVSRADARRVPCHVSDCAGEGDRAIAFGLGPSCSGHRLRDGALVRKLRAVRETRFRAAGGSSYRGRLSQPSSGQVGGGGWQRARGAVALPTSPAAGLRPVGVRASDPAPRRGVFAG